MLLMRMRHTAFVTIVIAVPYFIVSFFAYFVGCFAAVVAVAGCLVVFHRGRSTDLLLFGIVPCYGGLCGCTPVAELSSARLVLLFGAVLALASTIIAIVSAFFDVADWLVAMRIVAAALGALMTIGVIGTFGALQVAVQRLSFVADARSRRGVSTGPPTALSPGAPMPYRTEPYYWDAAGNQQGYATSPMPPVVNPHYQGGNSDPYAAASPAPYTRGRRGSSRRGSPTRQYDPYADTNDDGNNEYHYDDDGRDVVPAAAFNAGAAPSRRSAEPVPMQFVHVSPVGGSGAGLARHPSGLRPLSSYPADWQAETQARRTYR